MDIPGTLNTMIFATMQPTTKDDFGLNIASLSQDPTTHPLLITTMTSTYTNLKPSYETTTVYTDDLAPIEWIVNNMVVSFVLQGGVEILR